MVHSFVTISRFSTFLELVVDYLENFMENSQNDAYTHIHKYFQETPVVQRLCETHPRIGITALHSETESMVL